MFDSNGPEVLDRHACLTLLGAARLGRIVYTERAMPAIQPVPFVLRGETIILCMSWCGKLSAAVRDTVVAFEAGWFSDDLNSGWSVRVIGRATEISAPEELAELAAIPLRSWDTSANGHYLRVTADLISGRRLAIGT
jgi:nitroimidazol reductase NimA-like FMN-containing flavoprotein (pyridoxamine 5'-phosphate oxidase superfamily)